MLVIGVEEQHEVEGLGDLGHRHVILIRLRKHHVQEVVAERQLLFGKHERQPFLIAIDHRDDCADLRHGDGRGQIEALEILLEIVRGEMRVIRGQRTHHGGQHGHRRRTRGKALQDFLHLGLDGGVLPELEAEFLALGGCRELAVDDQIGRLDEIAVMRELLDGVTPVAKDAVIAVEKGDLALARAGVAIALIVGDVAGRRAQCTGIDRFFALGADHHRQGVFFVVDLQRGSRGHGATSEAKSGPLAKETLPPAEVFAAK